MKMARAAAPTITSPIMFLIARADDTGCSSKDGTLVDKSSAGEITGVGVGEGTGVGAMDGKEASPSD
jgi:hypothetical protein